MSKCLFIGNIGSRNNYNFSSFSIMAGNSLGIKMDVAYNDTSGRREDEISGVEKELGVTYRRIDFHRNPVNPHNVKAYKQLVALMKAEKYDMVHCNTPVGGLLGRLAAKKCGVKRVIYQAHGFHFYKGAPLLNWLVYYPIERWLSHYTNALITINKEDYKRAQKFHLRNHGKVYYVPGVGIDVAKYQGETINRNAIRGSLGVVDDDVMLMSIGDLIERKNYETAIQAIHKAKNKKLKYCICGKGDREEELKKLAASLGIGDQVLFLGFRTDIRELLHVADIFLFTTKQEGLPRSMMEAMASGLPCVVSKIRGNIDLIEDGIGGYLCEPDEVNKFAKAIHYLTVDKTLRKKMGISNLETIKKFDIVNVKLEMKKIYTKVLTENIKE